MLNARGKNNESGEKKWADISMKAIILKQNTYWMF